jgi:hypothetical protein
MLKLEARWWHLWRYHVELGSTVQGGQSLGATAKIIHLGGCDCHFVHGIIGINWEQQHETAYTKTC